MSRFPGNHSANNLDQSVGTSPPEYQSLSVQAPTPLDHQAAQPDSIPHETPNNLGKASDIFVQEAPVFLLQHGLHGLHTVTIQHWYVGGSPTVPQR